MTTDNHDLQELSGYRFYTGAASSRDGKYVGTIHIRGIPGRRGLIDPAVHIHLPTAFNSLEEAMANARMAAAAFITSGAIKSALVGRIPPEDVPRSGDPI